MTTEHPAGPFLADPRLPRDGWRLCAVPPRIRGMATFPVRAFALVG
jgi:kynurenine formamidase